MFPDVSTALEQICVFIARVLPALTVYTRLFTAAPRVLEGNLGPRTAPLLPCGHSKESKVSIHRHGEKRGVYYVEKELGNCVSKLCPVSETVKMGTCAHMETLVERTCPVHIT